MRRRGMRRLRPRRQKMKTAAVAALLRRQGLRGQAFLVATVKGRKLWPPDLLPGLPPGLLVLGKDEQELAPEGGSSSSQRQPCAGRQHRQAPAAVQGRAGAQALVWLFLS